MSHTDVIPTSASIASTGKGIRYIGKFCFGYSGLKNAGASSAEVSFLDFTTGAGIIVGQFQFFYATDTVQGTDALYRIKLNGQTVVQYLDTEDIRMAGDPHQPVPMIIPPLSRVETTIAMLVGAQQQASTFTGRVYGAE